MNISMIEPTGRTVGAAPLFRQFADEIALVPLLNQMLPWDTRQTRVSPEERILLLILDVLAGKSPLYRMADRLVTTDVEVLIGAGRRPADFSDDSLGRPLDKLARAEPAQGRYYQILGAEYMFYDPDTGKRRETSTTFATEREAQKWGRDQESRYREEPNRKLPSDKRFGAYFEEWLNDVVAGHVGDTTLVADRRYG